MLNDEGEWVPYDPHHFRPRDRKLRIHQPGDANAVISDCELAKGDIAQWRFRGSSPAGSRKSARTSEGQSPAGAMSQPISAAEVEERLVRKQQKDLQKAHRSVMRQACLRRDQFCVLTGECEDTAVKCCHVLTPEYAAKWFAEDTERMEFLCGLPIGAGRYLPGFDTRNGLIMQAALHEMYDAFLFSIWPNEDDNKVRVGMLSTIRFHFIAHPATIQV